MKLTQENWKCMFASVSVELRENAEELSRMDAITGDGDHGVTMNKIAKVMEERLGQWQEGISLPGFLEGLSVRIMGVNGGCAGPLWGNLFAGFARGVSGEAGMDEQGLVRMFTAGLTEMQEITTAKRGDKTMMDALIPAVEALQKSRGEMPEMLRQAAVAARQGAENTANFIAGFGRAKNLKEKSLGHRDPGAVSLSLFFDGLANGLFQSVEKIKVEGGNGK